MPGIFLYSPNPPDVVASEVISLLLVKVLQGVNFYLASCPSGVAAAFKMSFAIACCASFKVCRALALWM